jgi:hypothetical protein
VIFTVLIIAFVVTAVIVAIAHTLEGALSPE